VNDRERSDERRIRPFKLDLPSRPSEPADEAVAPDVDVAQTIIDRADFAIEFEPVPTPEDAPEDDDAAADAPPPVLHIQSEPLVPRVPLSCRTFEEALDTCRELHPLPFELLVEQTEHHATWLINQVKKVETEEQLEQLAYRLDYRDLSTLFMTLANLKKRSETDPIQNIIRLRASHYLYICGWTTFQFCYPRSSVARALADLCAILEDIRFVRDTHQTPGGRSRRTTPSVDLGPHRVIWNRIPLISEIALPNSRVFIAAIASEIYESRVDIDRFFHRYAIYRGLPLGDAIVARYEEMVSGISQNPLLSKDFFDRFRGS
jgi:hypothetical protein